MEALYHSFTPAQQQKFLDGPALKPPLGVVPNFDNPPNGNALCYSVLLLSICVSTIVVLMRAWARISCAKKYRVEDFFMIAALAIYAGFIYIVWICYLHPGSFVHQWNNINVACILYGVALLLLKVAIFLDWIHVFGGSQGIRGGFYWACIANIVVNFVFYTTTIFVMIFACTPRSKIWNQLEEGKCVNIFAVNVASSVFNFILDLVMLSMPQRIIWNLQLSTKKKVAVSLLFAVGVFGCICGALRVVYSIPFMKSPDKTYAVSSFALSGMGEMTACFLVLCVPSIPKLVKNTALIQKIFGKIQIVARQNL
ncbi:hypothetical protein GQ44DRAFT_735788 [Phaeosphaeriaceae sp. PMI808]|nr:hypothetical protein GQ44DRAFT_735788 [Phaeosphaeriaceae sp. PMI808]